MKLKTKKLHTSPYTPDPLFTAVTKSLPATLGFAALAVAMGILFIVLQGNTDPVPREEAIAYEGEFARYEVGHNDRDLCFADGSSFDVYAHTETNAFQETLKSLEAGTKLWILVHPHTDYVIEIRTETEELMNFEESQIDIDRYVVGYKVIGGIAIFAGLFIGFYGVWSQFAHRKEEKRSEARRKKQKKTAEAKKLLQRIIDRKAGVINDMGFIVWVTQCEQLMTAIENGDLPVKPAPAAKKSAPAKK